MKILDMINSPWAIDPLTLNDIVSTYKSFMRQDKIDFKTLLGDKSGKPNELKIVNQTAVIPIKGPITKGDGFFSFFFNGASTRNIKTQIEQSIESPDVSKIILDIDSPGGTVDGSFELADFITKAKEQISIESFSDGSMTSAAYLIAAATDKIFISGKTNRVGSIGVIATHIDFSKQNEQFGETITEIVSGKFKNAFSPDMPLSDLGKQALQDQVNYTFSIFAQDVADRRNMTVESIVNMEAAVFIGQQSIDIGLVDGVSTLDQLTKSVETKATEVNNMTAEKTILTIAQIKSEHPDIYNEICETSATAERARILKIQSAAFPGQEVLTEKMINDPLISVGDAALQFNVAEKSIQSEKVKEIADELKTNPVDIIENPEVVTDEAPEKEFMVLVKDYQNTNSVSLKQAMSDCVVQYPKEHNKFLKRG